MLKEITPPETQCYRARVYILSCSNLTAVENYSDDFKTYIGGYRGLSKANPYPVVSVGPPPKQYEIDYQAARFHYKPNTLSPEFFRIYDLDAYLPEDWRLEISIWSRVEAPILGMIANQDILIGSTVIDLE